MSILEIFLLTYIGSVYLMKMLQAIANAVDAKAVNLPPFYTWAPGVNTLVALLGVVCFTMGYLKTVLRR
jgi:hypothetical protein